MPAHAAALFPSSLGALSPDVHNRDTSVSDAALLVSFLKRLWTVTFYIFSLGQLVQHGDRLQRRHCEIKQPHNNVMGRWD